MTGHGSPSAGTRGPFRHAAAIYDSDESFLAAVVPFVEDALAKGEPTILALTADQQALLGSVLGQPAGVLALAQGDHYGHPLSALRANRAMFEDHLQAGADRVRLVGELPCNDASRWPSWARYEALCNYHFADLAVSALCTYDARQASEDVLADVRRVHFLLADTDDHVPNPDYVEPEEFLARTSRPAADPIEASEPHVTLVGPTLADGRRAIAAAAARAGVAGEGLVTAVSEALTNAYVHGRPPVQLRAWIQPGRVIATVIDAGPGPSDPLVGLRPPDTRSLGGRGLWISNQLCDHFTISATDQGCLVRMVEQAEASRSA